MNQLSRSRPLLPEGEEREFLLQSDYFDGQIDLKAFCAAHQHHPILGTNPLVLEPQKDSFVFLARFGGVVFWNCPEPLIRQIHEELKSLPGLSSLEEQARDFLKVKVGAAEDSVEFSEVRLREFSLEKLRIVSLTLAQSVALDHFEAAVSRAMARFQPVVNALSHEGKLLLPHREVLRIVGFAMEVRAAVLDNLTLFDDPPETWESESLAHLDSALYGQFDLEERLGAIREKLAYLQDAGATFLGLLDTRKNHRLEWIIILLILVEILLFIGKDLGPLFFPSLR
jgi:required for meiotic nuclear division protein 1